MHHVTGIATNITDALDPTRHRARYHWVSLGIIEYRVSFPQRFRLRLTLPRATARGLILTSVSPPLRALSTRPLDLRGRGRFLYTRSDLTCARRLCRPSESLENANSLPREAKATQSMLAAEERDCGAHGRRYGLVPRADVVYTLDIHIEADDPRGVFAPELLRNESHLRRKRLNEPPKPAVCDPQPRVLVPTPTCGCFPCEELCELIEEASRDRSLAGRYRGAVLAVDIQRRRRKPSIVAGGGLRGGHRCYLWILRLEIV